MSLVAVVVMSLGVCSYSESQSKVELSDLALENVEALAGGESGGSSWCCGYSESCGWSPSGQLLIGDFRVTPC